ncbi:helix-turn-helix domain-containing protein [Nevskia sp.]|uniref:AraC family transcriptional regulator n=1 Tax=Nevskia sp. TaxID=1929292 RepID=UPI0025E60E07|nr:helix-turn-helix domain-containing protein [Nevskia sp.]
MLDPGIRFGAWSTTLGLAALFGVSVALLLLSTRHNRVANRLLAALIAVIVLALVPYIIGFAGFYDAYPALSFAPFGWALAIGPLLYLQVLRQTSDRLPPRAWRHGIPVAVKIAYTSVIFVQPLAFKDDWDTRIHSPWIGPLETVLVFVSLTVYLAAAFRVHRRYQRWLVDHVSNREEFRLDAQRNTLIAFAILTAIWLPYEIASAAFGFNYFDRYPLYVLMALLVCALGLEGWRHAELRYPLPLADPAPPAPIAEPAGRDWAADGQRWLARTRDAGWWRDPELNVERLARHLATNTAYLSRAFNEGLGLSFNEAINRLRVDAVRVLLADPSENRDLLDIAFAAGFSSKSSFNRVFKAQTGETPSRFRERAQAERPES